MIWWVAIVPIVGEEHLLLFPVGVLPELDVVHPFLVLLRWYLVLINLLLQLVHRPLLLRRPVLLVKVR